MASSTTEHGNLKKDVCAKEFAMLMDCFTEAVSCLHFVFHFTWFNFSFGSLLGAKHAINTEANKKCAVALFSIFGSWKSRELIQESWK